MPILTIFQLYRGVAVSFIGWGNWSPRRKPPASCKSLTNFITKCYIEHTLPWTGFELTTLVVISTDCTGSLNPTILHHDHDSPLKCRI